MKSNIMLVAGALVAGLAAGYFLSAKPTNGQFPQLPGKTPVVGVTISEYEGKPHIVVTDQPVSLETCLEYLPENSAAVSDGTTFLCIPTEAVGTFNAMVPASRVTK